MTFSELILALKQVDKIKFQLPNGKSVPAHFHVTEVGVVTKEFVDCSGTYRKTQQLSLQLWSSIDFHHQLKADKLIDILSMTQDKLSITDEDLPISVEYQGSTIELFELKFDGQTFQLTSTSTDCLAKSDCGVEKVKETVKELATACCTPGGGCC